METPTVVQALHPSELLNVRQVAVMLGCSTRHVYRLADAGRMPRPVRLGALCRWPKTALCDWIATGCKPVRSMSVKGGASW